MNTHLKSANVSAKIRVSECMMVVLRVRYMGILLLQLLLHPRQSSNPKIQIQAKVQPIEKETNREQAPKPPTPKTPKTQTPPPSAGATTGGTPPPRTGWGCSWATGLILAGWAMWRRGRM